MTRWQVFLAPTTARSWEWLMALGVIAHPITTMQASAVSESKQTPLALLWRFPSPGTEQPGIACGVVQGAPRPGTFRATCRVFCPWLNSRQGTRLNTDIIFLGTALETEAHRSINATSLYGMDRCRVRYTAQLEDNAVAKAEYINWAGSGRWMCAFRSGHIASRPLARQATQ